MDNDNTDLTNYVTCIKNKEKYDEAGKYEFLSDYELTYDSINVYFLRGYQLDSLDGITLSVKTSALCEMIDDESVYKNQTDVYLLDAYIDKSMLFPSNQVSGGETRTDPIHRLASPLYMNSKFYDKYITLEFPSPYAIALRDRNITADPEKYPIFMQFYWNEDGTRDVTKSTIYTLDPDASIILDFASVQSGNASVTNVKIDNSYEGHTALLVTPEYDASGCVMP